MKLRAGKNNSGFTVIELMVVVVILSALAGIAIPTFSAWLPNYRLKGAARDVYSHIQAAKLEAIRQNTDISVTFQTAPDRYNIAGAVPISVNLGDYGSGVNYDTPTGFSNTFDTITYNQRGICTAGNGTFVYISNSKKSTYYRIGPNAAGTVRVEKWNGTAFE